MRARFLALAATAVSLALAGALIAQQSLPPAPRPDVSITTKDLLSGLANPSRWLTYSGDYTGAASTARSRRSRRERRPAGRAVDVPDRRLRPEVRDDAARDRRRALHDRSDNHAWAIDAKTGRQIWRYQRRCREGSRSAAAL